ncbi:MAG: N-acetyltransferase family protein [Bdellovibrionales bacterium]
MSTSISSPPGFCIRPLTADDTQSYRMIRKKILHTTDARYFSDSYERERLLSENQWLSWCTEKPEHCILGTYLDKALVGIIMVTRQGGANSPVVEWEAAWLDPRYRGTGIGKLSYEHAKQWSQKQGYKFVAGFIRATYTPALDICKSQGFVYAYTIHDELWADGSVADTHAFLLDLRQEASAYASMPVFERFKEALPFLDQGLHAPPEKYGIKAA